MRDSRPVKLPTPVVIVLIAAFVLGLYHVASSEVPESPPRPRTEEEIRAERQQAQARRQIETGRIAAREAADRERARRETDNTAILSGMNGAVTVPHQPPCLSVTYFQRLGFGRHHPVPDPYCWGAADRREREMNCGYAIRRPRYNTSDLFALYCNGGTRYIPPPRHHHQRHHAR